MRQTRLAPRFALLLAAALAPLTTACSYSIHEVHVSDFESDGIKSGALSAGKIVRAEADRRIILGIAGDTDYVDEAYRKLMDACKGGSLSGITTQYSTAHGFFSWKSKILMQGLCVR